MVEQRSSQHDCTIRPIKSVYKQISASANNKNLNFQQEGTLIFKNFSI
jgi:hypothetical protein